MALSAAQAVLIPSASIICIKTPMRKTRKLNLVYGDLNDASSLNSLIKNIRPDEIYNLGAQSHVKVSFEVPEYTAEVTGLGHDPPFGSHQGHRGQN